jgi:hypothetical protein
MLRPTRARRIWTTHVGRTAGCADHPLDILTAPNAAEQAVTVDEAGAWLGAVVKQSGGDLAAVEGRLVVFDPTGKVLESLSDGVRTVHVARVGDDGGLIVMYERRRRFVLATIDRETLKLRSEQVFEIPSMK